MGIAKFHWIIGISSLLCMGFVFFWIWNSPNPESKGDLLQKTNVTHQSGPSSADPTRAGGMVNGPKDIVDLLDQQSGKATGRKPPMRRHQAFNPSSNSKRSIDDPLSADFDELIQQAGEMIDLDEGELLNSDPTEVQHLGEYLDPDSEDFLSLENPPLVQDLGEYIDPDEVGLLVEENPAEVQHLGEYLDPYSEDFSSPENPPLVQDLGAYLDPDAEPDYVSGESQLLD